MRNLLVLHSDREVTRDVVEAALWQTIGWAPENVSRVSRLMDLIDALGNNRVQRVILMTQGDAVPRVMPEPAQSAARAALAFIAGHGPVAQSDAIVPPRPRPTQRAVAEVTELRPRPAEPARHVAAVINDEQPQYRQPQPGTQLPLVTIFESEPEPYSDASNLRTCTACGVPKDPAKDFWKNSKSKDGIDRQCSACKIKKRQRNPAASKEVPGEDTAATR